MAAVELDPATIPVNHELSLMNNIDMENTNTANYQRKTINDLSLPIILTTYNT